MITFLTSKAGKLLILIAITAGILTGAVQWGAGREREQTRVEQLETFIETKEVIKDVQVSPTRDAAVERLRTNGWVR